jgi:hypothetical protein
MIDICRMSTAALINRATVIDRYLWDVYSPAAFIDRYLPDVYARPQSLIDIWTMPT